MSTNTLVVAIALQFPSGGVRRGADGAAEILCAIVQRRLSPGQVSVNQIPDDRGLRTSRGSGARAKPLDLALVELERNGFHTVMVLPIWHERNTVR